MVTVSVVLPLVNKEVGFNAQVLSVMAAGTAQLKLTVPVKPLMGVSVMAVVRLWPGAAMTILAGFADKVKSVALEMVTVTGVETGLWA